MAFRSFLRALAALALLTAFAPACARQIGDGCRLSTDCSINGDRICDPTQPAGYCTIPGCDPNACPDESLCIEFESQTPRLARRFCMQPCEVNEDCRPEYICIAPTVEAGGTCPEPMASGEPAPECNRLLDSPSPQRPRRKFCVPGAR
jgi:hypothetical protein